MNENFSPEFAILTAMQHEHNAVMCMMDRRPPVRDREGYLHYLTHARFGLYNVVVLSLVIGNNEAYNQTYQLINHFPTIKTVIFVGVAGANKNAKYGSQFEISDVVVPALIKDVEAPSREPYALPNKFRRYIVELADSINRESKYYREGLWETTIERFKVQNTDDWAIQEFNKTLEHPIKLGVDGILGTSRVSENNEEEDKTRGVDFVDQEGYAVAAAASNLKRDFLVVRGISDKLDRDQRFKLGIDTPVKDLSNQDRASRTAAAVCGLFMGKIGSDGFISREMQEAVPEYTILGSLSHGKVILTRFHW